VERVHNDPIETKERRDREVITIIDASIYSTSGEMAYQINYSNGAKFRAVIGSEIIRTEAFSGCAWIQCGKPYKVVKNKKRNAERLVKAVKEFLSA
jgi:hypothetical protein